MRMFHLADPAITDAVLARISSVPVNPRRLVREASRDLQVEQLVIEGAIKTLMNRRLVIKNADYDLVLA
jgi:hypothetical protein